MSQLENIANKRRENGFSCHELMKNDQEWAVCYTCRKRHALRGNNADHDYKDFACRHETKNGCIVLRISPEQMELIVKKAQRRKLLRHESILNFTHNASVLEAFQASDQSLDLTSFNSLAASVTVGWCSQYIDNSVNLYLDYLACVALAAVNTAASLQKAHYVYAATALNTTDLPINTAGNAVNSSSSAGAALTFLDITANSVGFSLINVIPYLTTNKAVDSGIFSTAQAFGGWIGRFLWYPYVNAAGPTIAASSNSFKYRGIYATVA